MGEGEGEGGFLSFTSLPFAFPSFRFSPETPDTQAKLAGFIARDFFIPREPLLLFRVGQGAVVEYQNTRNKPSSIYQKLR